MRKCGDCQLCCTLVPVKSLGKAAGQRCEHAKHGKGCSIYATRPNDCRFWSCAWLLEADTDDQRRPDRSHCIIDPVIETNLFMRNDDTGERTRFSGVQIWCDPKYPDAYLAPPILSFMRRRAAGGLATIVRYHNDDGITIIAPELSGRKDWVRYGSGKTPLKPMTGFTDRLSLKIGHSHA